MNKPPTEQDRIDWLRNIKHEYTTNYTIFKHIDVDKGIALDKYQSRLSSIPTQCDYIERVIFNMSSNLKKYQIYINRFIQWLTYEEYLLKLSKMNDDAKVKHFIQTNMISEDFEDYYRFRGEMILKNCIYDACKKFEFKMSDDEIDEISEKLEVRVYKQSGVLYQLDPEIEITVEAFYGIILTRISQNIINKDGFEKFLENTNQLKLFVNMNAIDINRSLYANILDEYKLRMQQEIKYRESTLYKCPKCHQNKCLVEDHMSARADEGIGKKITCMLCNNRWFVRG